MEKKQEILESRKRLDNTLSLPDLVNEDSITSLVKEQLMQASLSWNGGKVVENRTLEVTNFLEMLRSASEDENMSSNSHLKFHKDWKVKQDTDQLRVMYCEGPHGSPFHTLLAEGFADGPMDVCLCVSWESTLYKKWWPQYSVPTFKIMLSSCLQKVRIGEEISLIRMKVPWPVSDREAVVHYFEIEYFKEDLILVLIKTISDTELVDISTHGFSRDGIPEVKDAIRIDLVGGFVLQKVERGRCYFRAMFNFDIKLDFIPPSLINFISRQLIGNGHKLYQKAVGSVASSDEDYRKALQGPLYVRIRQHLDSHNKPATEVLDKKKYYLLTEHNTNATVTNHVINSKTSAEITEEDTDERPAAEADHRANGPSENLLFDKQGTSPIENAPISPEVERALGILDQVISVVRGQDVHGKNTSKSSSVAEDFRFSELKKASLPNNGNVSESNNKIRVTRKSEAITPTEEHRQSKMSPSLKGIDHNQGAASSQKERFTNLGKSRVVGSRSYFHKKFPSKASIRVMQPSTMDSTCKVCDEVTVNGFNSKYGPFSDKTKKMRKKQSICCFSASFSQD